MGKAPEESLALYFEGARSRRSSVALLFGFFDVLIYRHSCTNIQEIQDRPTSTDGDPIGNLVRSFIQYGQEHTPQSRQFPEQIDNAIAIEPALMAVTACVVLHERLLLAAQHADHGLGKRGQMVEQLTVVHLGEPFGLCKLVLRSPAPMLDNLVFVLF